MMVTCNQNMKQLYIIEYIVVFWQNDILVSTATQWDGSYQTSFYDHEKGMYKWHVKGILRSL